MNNSCTISRLIVTLFLTLFFGIVAFGEKDHSFAQETTQSSVLDDLFQELQNPDLTNPQQVERKIWKEWSRSGSDAMDFLLKRGRDAMEAGDLPAAIEHFSALIDHAPDFAEAWNARATAFFLSEEYGLSIADVKQTLILNPRHFGALSGLGIMLENLDQKEKALVAYEEAAKLNPHSQSVQDGIDRLKKALEGTAL